jgi:hypothetical protein
MKKINQDTQTSYDRVAVFYFKIRNPEAEVATRRADLFVRRPTL